MTDILVDQGLWDYILGIGQLADGTDDRIAWDKQDRWVLTQIHLRVALPNLVYVADALTSQKAWNALQDTFEAKGVIAKVLLQRKLFKAQCGKGDNVEDHIRTMRGYFQEYNILSTTSPLSEEDFVMMLLTLLPDSWTSFITAIDPATLTDLATNHWQGQAIVIEAAQGHGPNCEGEERHSLQPQHHLPWLWEAGLHQAQFLLMPGW